MPFSNVEWMEPVPEVSVDSLVLTPDVADSSLAVTVRPSAGASPDAKVTATAHTREGRKAGSLTGAAGTALRLSVPRAHLWSPDDPYLYDLDVTLTDGRGKDRVRSCFGMRSIEVSPAGGTDRIKINGRPVFVLATLDQGFWPDGLHTVPPDEALKYDLVQHKRLGFNAVRKHITVEPARWYSSWSQPRPGTGGPTAPRRWRTCWTAGLGLTRCSPTTTSRPSAPCGCSPPGGLRVPEDVALVGFDDIEEGRYGTITLTTISPDKKAVARQAVDHLVQRLAGAPEADATPRAARLRPGRPRVHLGPRPLTGRTPGAGRFGAYRA